MSGFIKRTLERFEESRVVGRQVRMILWSFDLHRPLKRSYDQEYGSPARDRAGSRQNFWSKVKLRAGRERQVGVPVGSLRRRSSTCPGRPCQRAGREKLEDRDLFPDYNKFLRAYKTFSTTWMVYIILKYLLNRLRLSKLLQHSLGLSRPLHCLLVGRSVENEVYVSTITSCLSCTIVAWRIIMMLTHRHYNLTGIYFALIKREQLARFYELIYSHNFSPSEDSEPSMELELAETTRPQKLERLILDTLCLRDPTSERISYKLRTNRTPLCLARFHHFIVANHFLSLVGAMAMLIVSIPYILLITPTDKRYLRIYSGCDPHLEHLDRRGELSDYSVTLTWHHALTILCDLVESLVIVLDGSAICVFGISGVIILNYDLILCWQQINKKLCKLVARERFARLFGVPRGNRQLVRFEREHFRRTMKKLQVEIFDFFHQIRSVDELLSNALSVATVGWLLIAGSLAQIIRFSTFKTPPSQIIFVLSFLVIALALTSICYLVLQRRCNQSYSSICTLMAIDRTGSWQGFMSILDLFTHKKACFTLFRHYPFGSTTFLKIVGYTFSAFFLVVSAFRETRNADSCDLS